MAESDLTLEEKQQLLRDLKTARFSGAKRIRFRERDVTYRTDEELRKAIEDLEGEIGNKQRRRATVAAFSTGL
jgi:hypothetical protein